MVFHLYILYGLDRCGVWNSASSTSRFQALDSGCETIPLDHDESAKLLDPESLIVARRCRLERILMNMFR